MFCPHCGKPIELPPATSQPRPSSVLEQFTKIGEREEEKANTPNGVLQYLQKQV